MACARHGLAVGGIHVVHDRAQCLSMGKSKRKAGGASQTASGRSVHLPNRGAMNTDSQLEPHECAVRGCATPIYRDTYCSEHQPGGQHERDMKDRHGVPRPEMKP